jgi:hypothetical protein
MINKKLLLLIFGIVVNFHSYSQWTDITSSIGGGLTSTTNMAKPYVFDVNNDNYPDFLVPVLTSVVSPYTKYWKLYKNNGNSTFTDATTSYGLPTNLSLSTLGFIDYNGDGFKDLYFYTATGLQILKNNNGTSFTDVSTQLGIASAFFISGEITSYPLKVFDYDLDGDEDLLYTRTISGANTLTAIVNNGTSFSTKVNIINSIPGATTGGINFSLFDMDNDGDFDIVFDAFSGTLQYSNGITTLYRKDAASYTNTTSTSGLANGLPGYISTIDINQDGNLDIVKGGADCCTSPLYRVFIGNGIGVFTEQTSTYSISNGGYKYNGTLTDFDNDTDFDFSWSNYTGTGVAPFRLYVNNGSNVFTENATTYGLNLGVTSGGVPIDDYGNGVWMDLDKDGDLDIILNREGSGSTSTTGNLWVKRNPLQGNYINIKLNGCGVNKSGIGAKIKLVVGTKTKWLYYEKSPDGNITNGTDTFHFGLGTATLINSITVYWPNNTTTVLNNVTGNQFLTIGGGAGGSSAPTASTSQTLCSGSTIANLSATGTNIKWYATSTGGNPLENTTALVTGTTYYASQTIGTCESTRTAVGVSINDPQITASTTTVCSGTTIQLDASNNLSNNVILENPVLSGLTQSNYTRGATTIKFYSWTYGLPGMLVYGDANQKYSSLEANIFVNNAVNAECSTGLAVGVKPNIFNDSYQYNGPGCYYLSMKNGRLSLLDGTANTPSGYWPNELIGVDIPEINFSLALNYKLKIEIKPNAHIYCYLNDVLRMDYTITGGIVSSGKMALITANSSYTFSGIKSSFIPSSFQWSTGETTATINPSPTTTTTYWCDVTTNGVTCRKNVTITVTPKTTPTFTQVAAVCSGATIATLPTTSTNAATGTWLPAVNNTATTTYSFTPTTGLCANTTTMTITVTPKTTPTFTQVAAVNSGATLAALPTTSNNGITGTWSPAINNTVTTLYTFTPTNGLCANTTTMTITVNPILGLSLNSPNYDFCSGNSYTITWTGGTPADLIRLQLADVTSWTTQMLVATNLPNTGSYTWSVPSGLGTGLKLLYIDNVNNRYDYNYGPTFKIYDVTSVTSKSRCGAGTVTLNAIANNGGVINWYATQTGNTLLASGNSFTTPTITATTTYWVDATNGVCTTGVRVPVTATINANVTPTFTQVAAVCSGASIAPLPTTSTNAVTGTWSPAINNLATTLYTFTPTAGLCANTATMTITINSTTPAPTGANNQTMTQGSTLANLVVTGQNIIWYSTPFGGTPLPANNTLVNGITYYASQTINKCESQYRLPVIVEVTLSNKEFDTIKIVYNPNPVTDILNIKASTELKNAKIFNLLGQTIFQQTFNSKEIQLNMSDFPTGTYFVLVESDDINETFKIVKK